MAKIREGSKIVSQTGNLRGLLDYTRTLRPQFYTNEAGPVFRPYVTKAAVALLNQQTGSDPQAHLTVWYSNGAVGSSYFQSFSIAVDWVKARRSWCLKVTSETAHRVEFTY